MALQYGKPLEVYGYQTLFREIGYYISRLERYESSLKYFDEAIKKTPTDKRALMGRSKSRAKVSQYEGALSDVNKALGLDEDDLVVLAHKALNTYLCCEFEDGLVLNSRLVPKRQKPETFAEGVMQCSDAIENCLGDRAGRPLRDHFMIVRKLAWKKNYASQKPFEPKPANKPKKKKMRLLGKAPQERPELLIRPKKIRSNKSKKDPLAPTIKDSLHSIPPDNEFIPALEVEFPHKPLQSHTTNLENYMAEKYLESMYLDKIFLSKLISQPGAACPNIEGSLKIRQLAKSSLKTVSYKQELLRTRRPFYFIKYQEATLSGALEAKQKAILEIQQRNTKLEAAESDEDGKKGRHFLKKRKQSFINNYAEKSESQTLPGTSRIQTAPLHHQPLKEKSNIQSDISDSDDEPLNVKRKKLQLQAETSHITDSYQQVDFRKETASENKILEDGNTAVKIQEDAITENNLEEGEEIAIMEKMNEAYEERDLKLCLEMVKKLKRFCDSKSKKLLPDKSVYLESSLDVACKAWYDYYRLNPNQSDFEQGRRIYAIFGLPMSREPSTDSVVGQFKNVFIDYKKEIVAMEKTIEETNSSAQVCWYFHELSRYYIDLKKYDLSRFYARKCIHEAKGLENQHWIFNCQMLLIKNNLIEHNKNDAKNDAIKAHQCVQALKDQDKMAFVRKSIQIIDSVEFDDVFGEKQLEKREQKIIQMMASSKMKDEVAHLFRQMAAMPASRRMVVMPGVRAEEKSVPKTKRGMSIMPGTGNLSISDSPPVFRDSKASPSSKNTAAARVTVQDLLEFHV